MVARAIHMHSHQIHLSLRFRGVAWETRYEGGVAHHSHYYMLEHKKHIDTHAKADFKQ